MCFYFVLARSQAKCTALRSRQIAPRLRLGARVISVGAGPPDPSLGRYRSLDSGSSGPAGPSAQVVGRTSGHLRPPLSRAPSGPSFAPDSGGRTYGGEGLRPSPPTPHPIPASGFGRTSRPTFRPSWPSGRSEGWGGLSPPDPPTRAAPWTRPPFGSAHCLDSLRGSAAPLTRHRAPPGPGSARQASSANPTGFAGQTRSAAADGWLVRLSHSSPHSSAPRFVRSQAICELASQARWTCWSASPSPSGLTSLSRASKLATPSVYSALRT